MPPRPYAEPLTEDFGVGRGWQEIVRVPQPAAGAEINFRLEGQYISRLKAATWQLAAGVAAGTRVPSLQYRTANDDIVAVTAISTGIGASTTGTVVFWIGAQQFSPAGLGVQVGPLFDLFMQAGDKIVSVTPNLAAGDQISKVVLTIERFYSDLRPAGRPRQRRRPRALAGA